MHLRRFRPTGTSWLAAGLLLAAAIAGPPAGAAEGDRAVIAGDGFESGTYQGGNGWAGGWNLSSAASIVATDRPGSGIRHLEMRGSAVAGRSVDLTGWAEVELSFWARARSLDSGDYVYVQVSPDGNAWQVLETWGAAHADDRYHLYQYDLPAADQWERLYIRFLSRMDEPTDYFYVDDVLVQGVAAPQGGIQLGDLSPAFPGPVPIAPVTVNLAAASGGGGIVIDGEFSDWAGHPHLTDPQGDATKSRGDLSAFYWTADLDARISYYMIERYPARDDDDDGHLPGQGAERGNALIKPVKYTIYIDTNNNGVFDGPDDRRVQVDYHPKADRSDVRVRVQPGNSGRLLYSASGDWGESIAQGGRRVELAVPWKDLGIGKGDAIRMYVESQWHDRLPDSGDIQWTVASILGHWLLGAVLLAGAVALWWVRRRREQPCPSG